MIRFILNCRMIDNRLVWTYKTKEEREKEYQKIINLYGQKLDEIESR